MSTPWQAWSKLKRLTLQPDQGKIAPRLDSTWRIISNWERPGLALQSAHVTLAIETDSALDLICNWERLGLALQPAEDTIALGPGSARSLGKRLTVELVLRPHHCHSSTKSLFCHVGSSAVMIEWLPASFKLPNLK